MKTGTALLTKFNLILFCFLLILPAVNHAVEDFSINTSTSISNDGSLNLSWNLPENTRIEIQQSSKGNADFETIYTGSDTATVITGLSNGEYLFRARLISADGSQLKWTEKIELEVKHHSLTRALGFFVIGAIVFLGTLILILSGAKKSNRKGAALE